MFGIDCTSTPSVASLNAFKIEGEQVSFVCRYFAPLNSETEKKVLTPGEAQTLTGGGLSIVSNFEWYANRALEGRASGIADAQTAEKQHAACGGPDNRPIYFSVDFEATTAQIPALIAYFQGVASVIGLPRTGAYGSYEVIMALFDAGVIAWGWQTYAWSNGKWEARAQLQQYQNNMSIGGHAVDYDRSAPGVSDVGQWGGSMSVLDHGWKDDGTILTAPNGHSMRDGFRKEVLGDEQWNPDDQPNEEEYATPQVLLHNASVGAGTRITTRDHELWWTALDGVHVEPFLGLELFACYNQINTQAAEITSLKAQLAQQPTGTPVDTTPVVADLSAVETDLSKAQTDLKKL